MQTTGAPETEPMQAYSKSRCAVLLGVSTTQVERLIEAGRLAVAPVTIHGGADTVSVASLRAELLRRGIPLPDEMKGDGDEERAA